MKLNYHVLPQSIVLNFDGKTFTVHREDLRHKKITDAIKANDLDSIPSLVDPARAFDGTPFTLVEGQVKVNGDTLPDGLSKRMLDLQRDGLPFTSLVNFWEKLKLNPSFNSRQMLYKFLEHNGHPLTEDGNFIAYRGVSEDFKDKHTGKFDNSVGSVCELPRDQVDDNPNNTCSHGLHVACYDYAKDFGPKLVEVEINPADVVAVPTDYNGTKMRVCKFKVVALGSEIREESVYGQPVNGDYETEEEENEDLELLKNHLADVEMSIQQFDTENDEIDDLINLREERMELESKIYEIENNEKER